MEIRARFVLIGVFVLAVVAAGFGFVYWIENTSGLGKQTSYRIRFDQSVSGLLLGSAVQFNGIRVGEVTDLKLDKDDPRRVLVTIAVAADTPVRADTTVGLVFGGLTGVPEIALTGGSPSSPPPAASDGGLPLLVASDSAERELDRRGARCLFDVRHGPLRQFRCDQGCDRQPRHILQGAGEELRQPRCRRCWPGAVDGRLDEGAGGNVVQLAAPKDFPQLAKEPAGQLIVGRPSAPVALETQRILLEAADGSVAPSFDEAQWGDSLPLLVQAKLIESFENAGYSRVASDLSGVSAEHQLLIELRAFRVVAGDTPMADGRFHRQARRQRRHDRFLQALPGERAGRRDECQRRRRGAERRLRQGGDRSRGLDIAADLTKLGGIRGERKRRMRVLICGGGAIGASTAYFLSRRGADVVVIERTGIACAASGKSGGFLALDWCDGTPLQALARRSFALHASLAEEIDDDWGYRRMTTYGGFGGARLGGGGPRLDWVADEVALDRRLGTTATTAQVHPGLYTKAMMRAAESQRRNLCRGRSQRASNNAAGCGASRLPAETSA